MEANRLLSANWGLFWKGTPIVLQNYSIFKCFRPFFWVCACVVVEGVCVCGGGGGGGVLSYSQTVTLSFITERAFHLMKTKEMILLSFAIAYTGTMSMFPSLN